MPDPEGSAHYGYVRQLHGTATEHHGRSFDNVHGPFVPTRLGPMQLWDLRLGHDALVLGGRQRLTDDQAERARRDGVEVTTRRSGGGAVYLNAATSLWVDLWFPAQLDQPLPDLAELFVAVGEWWASGLQRFGLNPQVHRGPGSSHGVIKELAKRVCFADVGWGEVTVGDAKVVGLSQRRVRAGARVQCVVDLNGGGASVIDYLELSASEREIVGSRTAAVSDYNARQEAAVLVDDVLTT